MSEKSIDFMVNPDDVQVLDRISLWYPREFSWQLFPSIGEHYGNDFESIAETNFCKFKAKMSDVGVFKAIWSLVLNILGMLKNLDMFYV